MNTPYSSTPYNNHGSIVSWRGVEFQDNDDLSSFLSGKVADRLDDSEEADAFQTHLRGLNLTGMGKEALEEVLSSNTPEERDWAAGEALAETVLNDSQEVVFPWNMERDKRNALTSLAGADIVGFQKYESGHRLVLGEVKTSQKKNTHLKLCQVEAGILAIKSTNLLQNCKQCANCSNGSYRDPSYSFLPQIKILT